MCKKAKGLQHVQLFHAYILQFHSMLWYAIFDDMLWDFYCNELFNDMVCYAMIYYEIWTKTPLDTEEFHTFRSKIIKNQCLPLICYVNIYYFIKKHLKLSEFNHVVCYAMKWYGEWESMRLYTMLRGSNAMIWDSMQWCMLKKIFFIWLYCPSQIW